jgi:hypothetical protein
MYNKSGPVKKITKQLTAKEVPQNEETVSQQSPKDVPSKSSKDVITTKEQQSTQQRHQSSNHRASDVKTDWKSSLKSINRAESLQTIAKALKKIYYQLMS